MDDHVFRTAENKCPACDTKLSAATCPTDPTHRPKPGDFTICIYCATTARFDENLSLRIPEEGEFDEIDPRVRAQLDVVVKTIQDRLSWN